MKFITIIPWQVWIIALVLAVALYTFGLPGFVFAATLLLLL